MVYVNEMRLKKEVALINNSLKMKKENIPPYDNLEKIDRMIEEYEHQKHNITKTKIEYKIIDELKKCYVPDYSNEKFGEMIIMMLEKILKKHSFNGYTQEWKEDFYVDAVEKIFKYMHNFDVTKISQRTKKPVKAFAYFTQIIHQSFISVINKKNEEKLKSEEHQKNIWNEAFGFDIEKVNTIIEQQKERINTKNYHVIECNSKKELFNKIKNITPEPPNVLFVYKDEPLTFDEYEEYLKIKPKNININIKQEKTNNE